jgi:hypothetical protein
MIGVRNMKNESVSTEVDSACTVGQHHTFHYCALFGMFTTIPFVGEIP